MKCLIITNKFMFHLSFTADFLDFLSFNICLLPFSTPLYLFIYSVTSVVSNSLWPYGLWPTRLLCLWDFPGKSTEVGCHALLQGIFLTQGSKPCLLHWRWILYCWATQESVFLYYIQYKSKSYKLKKSYILVCQLSEHLKFEIFFLCHMCVCLCMSMYIQKHTNIKEQMIKN